AADAGGGTHGHAAELAVLERRIGGQHDDDRALVTLRATLAQALCERRSDVPPGHDETFQLAEVREHQRAEHVVGLCRARNPRARADAALEAEARHAAARADGAAREVRRR